MLYCIIACVSIIAVTLVITKSHNSKELSDFNEINKEYKEKDNIDFSTLDSDIKEKSDKEKD